MASKQGLKLFDIQNRLRTIYLRMTDMIKYGLLRQQKELLILGDSHHPLLKPIVGLMGNRWRITLLASEERNPALSQYSTVEQIQLQDNYRQVEEKFKDKTFNSIMVLPSQPDVLSSLDFNHENVVSKLPPLHHRMLMMNILAYRLAHKNLNKTGVVIFSASQKQILPYKFNQKNPEKAEMIHQLYGKDVENSLATGLTSTQVAYMSVIAGDREYTHFNSKIVVGLTNQIWQEEKEQVAKRYEHWAKGIQLPASGSFALFKAPFEKAQSPYVQYL